MQAVVPDDAAAQPVPLSAGAPVPAAQTGDGTTPASPGIPGATGGAPATAIAAAMLAAEPAATANASQLLLPDGESVGAAAARTAESADASLLLAAPQGSGEQGAQDGTADPGSNPAFGGGGLPAVAAGRSAVSQAAPMPTHPPVLQLAEPLIRAARAGVRRVEIALEPAALGRVEVRLDFAGDGRMSALVVADSRAALDALRSDAQALSQALSEAGIDSAGLDFGLRHREPNRDEGGFAAAPGRRSSHARTDEATPLPGAGRGASAPPMTGRLDVRA